MPIILIFFFAYWLRLDSFEKIWVPLCVLLFCVFAQRIAAYGIALAGVILAMPFLFLPKKEIPQPTWRYLP